LAPRLGITLSVRVLADPAAAAADARHPNRGDAVYAKLDAGLARGPAPFAVLGGPPGVPHLLSARLGCERYFLGALDVSALCINGE
jgi:hypothetical protein